MKHLKNILEGILSDIDVTLDSTDKTVKKIAALNTKADTFEEFVKAFADYFGCDMPKIKKGKGKLSNIGFKHNYGRKPDLKYENCDVADIKITENSKFSTSRTLYSLRFVKYLNGFYLQIKSTFISSDYRATGYAVYQSYYSTMTIKEFMATMLKYVHAFDKIFDKKDFN